MGKEWGDPGWGSGRRGCRSTHDQGLVLLTLALNSELLTKAHPGGAGPASSPLPPVPIPALSFAISLSHPRFSSLSKTLQTSPWRRKRTYRTASEQLYLQDMATSGAQQGWEKQDRVPHCSFHQ